jgi:uncharacterized protein
MSSFENKEVIRRIYAALERGDTNEFSASVHPDYVWRISGQCTWSRTFAGRETVLRDLVRPLFRRFAGRYKASLCSAIAEGDVVVAQVEGNVLTKEGQPYNNSYCFIFTFRDGKIAEMVEYGDTDLEERVLGPYQGAIAALD